MLGKSFFLNMDLTEKVGLWIGIIVGSGTILYNIYKYRNLLLIPLKWCVTKYKNIKAKIVDWLCNVWEVTIGRGRLKKRYELEIAELNIAHQIQIKELEVAHQSEITKLTESHLNEIQNRERNAGANYLTSSLMSIPTMEEINRRGQQ